MRVHPGVSRLAVIEWTPIHGLHAAMLAAGSGSLVSHLSAASLWGAAVPGHDPVDVTVTDRRRGLRLHGVRLHRPRDVVDLRPVRRQGFDVTNPLRTALDVGAVAGPAAVASIVECFVIKGYFGMATLRRGIAAHARPGRRGLGPLRIVLDDWCLGDKPPDSVLELAMGRLLQQHRLPAAVFHHVVRTATRSFELDFGLVDQRIDIEVDGWAYHGHRRAFEADRERDADLAAAGWHVLRFTWHQVTQRPDWVASRIGAVVGQRS